MVCGFFPLCIKKYFCFLIPLCQYFSLLNMKYETWKKIMGNEKTLIPSHGKIDVNLVNSLFNSLYLCGAHVGKVYETRLEAANTKESSNCLF